MCDLGSWMLNHLDNPGHSLFDLRFERIDYDSEYRTMINEVVWKSVTVLLKNGNLHLR